MTELALVFFLIATLQVIESKSLDMALNTVDDQYINCREKMMQVVNGSLLDLELNTTPGLSSAWKEEECKATIQGGGKIHTKALALYAHYKRFRLRFTNGVQTLGGNASVYNKDFLFKSFHFLLMDTLRLLKPSKCQTVFHGSGTEYTADVGSEVRLGSFVSAEEKLADVVEESTTVFNITSCSAIYIYKSACEPEDIGSWLLSPAEVFYVDEVKKHAENSYTEIVLRSSKIESNQDCQYNFPRPPATTTVPTPRDCSTPQWITSRAFHLMALSLSASLSITSY